MAEDGVGASQAMRKVRKEPVTEPDQLWSEVQDISLWLEQSSRLKCKFSRVKLCQATLLSFEACVPEREPNPACNTEGEGLVVRGYRAVSDLNPLSKLAMPPGLVTSDYSKSLGFMAL